MNPADAGQRLPWQPLEGWRNLLGSRWLCRELNVTAETLVRWRVEGVPAAEADRVARRLAADPTGDRGWRWRQAA